MYRYIEVLKLFEVDGYLPKVALTLWLLKQTVIFAQIQGDQTFIHLVIQKIMFYRILTIEFIFDHTGLYTLSFEVKKESKLR